MLIRVRPGIESDAEGMSRVHFEAVRGTAVAFYPPAVIEGWAPLVDEGRFEQFRRAISGQDELFFVADHSAEGVVGFGSIVVSSHELRAVYVHPRFGRCGLGSAILRELEQAAIVSGVPGLDVTSSVNAEKFYLRHGYEALGRSMHRSSSGVEMACVKMRKTFLGRAFG
jgi:putative acetyltransferase